MSESHTRPVTPHNLEQQHKRSKDLLRAARAGDAAALERLRAHRPDAGEPKLADAQLAIAREAGFASWVKLAAHLREAEVHAFKAAVEAKNAALVGRLLNGSRELRKHVNAPVFVFGQRALHIAANHSALVDVLLAFGADIHLRSDWDNGPFTVLDRCDTASARALLARGATLTPHVAARLGWFDDLRELVERNPEVVHERGGDGQQPLHLAATPEIADYLLDRGAGIDVRCIDHQSTPAQYAVAERPDVCRRLLARGATPDIFMPARLGDVALAERVLAANPASVSARINEPGYDLVPPLHIYCWTLGFGLSPHEVALQRGHRHVYDLLVARSPARVVLLDALLREDETVVRETVARDPSLPAALGPADHALLAHAIFHGRFHGAELMLSLGFDPAAGGVDGGSALHAACWMGHAGLVERVIAHGGVPLDTRDPTHGSTPLGWTAFGSVHRRAQGADYVGVIDRLVSAGADVHAPGNGNGKTLLEMAEGNRAVQEALRRHGRIR